MKTILHIEDNSDHARLVRRILEPHGYHLLHASDGESGLRMAVENTPALILLDLGLPDLDGQTLIGLLKSMPELAQSSLVVLTAWPLDTGERMARAYGCDGYSAKPISARELPAQIAAYLAKGS